MKKVMQFVQVLAISSTVLALTMIGVQSINASEVTTLSKPNSTKRIEINETYYDLSPKVRMTMVFHNRDLKYVQLRNQGEDRIVASLFNQEYQIGQNDVVTIDPPNVPDFVLELKPYDNVTAHGPLFSKAQNRVFHVKIPAQSNSTLASSVQMQPTLNNVAPAQHVAHSDVNANQASVRSKEEADEFASNPLFDEGDE